MHCEFTYTTNAFQDESWDLSHSKGYEFDFKEGHERKQKKFNKNREQRLSTSNSTETISDNSSIKQLAQYVKQLAEVLKRFEATTKNELKNIMKMIYLKEDKSNLVIHKIWNFKKK